MNIPKIEEAIILLYQTFIEDQNVATQRGIAITAMNEMVKLLGGDDVVKKIEAVPYSARLRAKHLFENEPQPKQEQDEPVAVVTGVYGGRFTYAPIKESVVLPVGMALYTRPQHREWVDLN